VQPRIEKLATALLAALALTGALASTASAQIEFKPCGDSNDFACGHLTVPLDPSGGVPGTVTLALRRHRAAVGEARDAIVALAGGPGQPAIPFAENFAELLGPIAATRDLIVLDQRGIGLSQPLSCHAFEHQRAYRSGGALVAACASQLGASRGFYTTADTVADLEAIRVAGGYEKLVLYGTSYGTKVAERYAQTYPTHVEALVLDSVVPPTGPEALDRSTFAAIPRVLRQICAKEECAHITPEPVADLKKVVARTTGRPLRGRVIDGHGQAHPVAISSNELLGMLIAGDFSSLLRAEFVTTVRSAANGDTAPLARLLVRASSGGGEGEDFDTPLYYATVCEEEDFPWSRAASPKQRVAQATAAARALGAGAFAPFTLANALSFSDIPECAYWPYPTPAPAPEQAAMPNVPTLILSGADDLRTPTANAREVAAQIPDAHLLVVPYTGHSVLGGEPTSCAREALEAMFAGHPIKPCPLAPPPLSLRPPPLPPTRLDQVAPTQGNTGLPGRTLQAVALTLGDFARQFALQFGEALGGGSADILSLSDLSSGGLRAGWTAYAKGTFTFHGYSYVPGLTISGTMRAGAIDLHVGGTAAAHGTLRLGSREALVGTLGGRGVHLLPSHTASVAIVGDNAQGSPHTGSRDAAARAALRLLARRLDRLVQP
jgi:pimeloyl-ACP methyl ester carboxylesterase